METKKEQEEYIFCKGCRCTRHVSEYEMYKGKRRKTCLSCKANRAKNKCPHNRKRGHCKECGGSQICPHDRRRSHCKECGGSSICEHDRLRYRCKQCSDNPLKLTFKKMINSSKNNDKEYDRYDADNFIDLCFLESLYDEFEDVPVCYYNDCKCKLQCMWYDTNLITIERLDNAIGHIKSNCVFCCLSCNSSRKSDKSE